MTHGPHDHDVAVLGGHLTPALLATVLSKQGLSVVIVDGPDDLDVATGDSTVPYTSIVFQLLAQRFQIPEIAAFIHLPDLPDAVREASGVKKSLTFLQHRAGEHHQPSRTVQFNVPGEHDEWHLHRPTVDEHARSLALSYGVAEVASQAPVSSVEVTDTGSTVILADGHELTARFVVDAAGTGSPLMAGATGALEPGGLRLRSRVLATHLRGVRPFEDGVNVAAYGPLSPTSAGTLHHLFRGGWIQIAPFGNQSAAGPTHCSVTVGLDPDRYADLPADPDAAFAALIKRFPSVHAQFAEAEAIRPWTHDLAWQRRARDTHGPGWFLLDRSASRTDEFLSRDVTMGLEMVHALGAVLPRILRAEAPAKGPAEDELARVARFQQDLIDYNDRMLAGARVAGGDFQLWNAFSRVWLLWQILASLSLGRAIADGQAGTWAEVERFESGALWFDYPAGPRELLDWFFAQLEQVSSGIRPAYAVADEIFQRLRREPFVPPLYRFADPKSRFYYFTRLRRLLMLAWVKTVAPADFKRLLAREHVTGRRED